MIQIIEKYLPQANIVESRYNKVRMVVREFWFEIKAVPAGLDLIQVIERVCTTLELRAIKVAQKIVPVGKILSDVDSI